MYVYQHTEPELWTVGYYDPDGKWHSESDHGSKGEASARVAYLNGGEAQTLPKLDELRRGCGHVPTDAGQELLDFLERHGFKRAE